MLSHVSQVPPTINCFEFFGFDVLIDNSLRPWLLEVNLSPALGNDCDADRSVKKPMLHDMFDLLGLPLYNTGLAIYHIWNDDTKENDVEEDKEVVEGDFLKSKPVINAAGRWRRKHRKMSAINNSRANSATRPATSVRPHSSARLKTRQPSGKSQLGHLGNSMGHLGNSMAHIGNSMSHLGNSMGHIGNSMGHLGNNMSHQGHFPKVTQNNKPKITSPNLTNLPKEKINLEDNKRISSTKRWGNGRDWTMASPSEGGWVRLWPMNLEVNNNNPDWTGKGNIKQMVGEVTKFSRLAKEIWKTHPTASELQLNEYLQEAMGMTRDVWIPPV